MYKKGGCEFTYLQSKNFVSALKSFVGEHFSLSLISGIERFFSLMMIRPPFPSILFCLTVPECFVGEPFCALEKFG